MGTQRGSGSSPLRLPLEQGVLIMIRMMRLAGILGIVLRLQKKIQLTPILTQDHLQLPLLPMEISEVVQYPNRQQSKSLS